MSEPTSAADRFDHGAGLLHEAERCMVDDPARSHALATLATAYFQSALAQKGMDVQGQLYGLAVATTQPAGTRDGDA